jgi:hypothetical protein
MKTYSTKLRSGLNRNTQDSSFLNTSRARKAMDRLSHNVSLGNEHQESIKPTSSSRPLGLYLQTALMYEIECLNGVAGLNNTRYVDLAGALANHLDIHITLAKGSEHASRYTNEVAHLLANKREDGHFTVDGNLGLVLVKGPLLSGILTVPLLFSSPTSRSIVVLDKLSSIAILTCTSLVLIRSTTTPNRSRVPNIPARKPWDTLFRFELTLSTTMRSFIVTAVGNRLFLRNSSLDGETPCGTATGAS